MLELVCPLHPVQWAFESASNAVQTGLCKLSPMPIHVPVTFVVDAIQELAYHQGLAQPKRLALPTMPHLVRYH